MDPYLAVESVLRRDRAVLLLAAGLLAAACWLLLGPGHVSPGAVARQLASPHAHAHGSGPGGFLSSSLMWLVMMVAMMLPPVMPWILLHGRMQRGRQAAGAPYGTTAAFAAGYFAVWGVYSLAAAGLQMWLEGLAMLDPVALATGPRLGAVLLIVAGLYQWSPLKSACLRHCRNPLTFFLTRWREGAAGAFEMGLRHGTFCVACCWALMALAFALGVMNLLWMAALTLLLCLEKIAPAGRVTGRAFGLVFVAWGALLLAT